jgi:Dehydrogenase E1 component
VKVSLLPNPSHLEAVSPVALGKARAKQYSLVKSSSEDCMLGDKVMCVQLHGDASFTGQGIVMETLGLSASPNMCSSIIDRILRQSSSFHEWRKCAHSGQVSIHVTYAVPSILTYLVLPVTSKHKRPLGDLFLKLSPKHRLHYPCFQRTLLVVLFRHRQDGQCPRTPC